MATSAAVKRKARNSGTHTRDRILDAAEIEFSKRGYDSCSLRAISEAYGVNLGLIYYYFHGKQDLFTTVFLRRSERLVTRRRELLAQAVRAAKNRPVDVADIIKCFIAPIVEMVKEGEGPRAYIRLQSLLRADTSAFARKLRGEAFGETNQIFIGELQRSCPHLPPVSVVWRFSAMVGAFYALVSQSGRVHELSGGLADSDDIDAMFAEIIPFVAGGFAAEPSG